MRLATSLVILAALGSAFAAPARAQSWTRRWRHGEARLGSEPDLSAATVTLFGDLVLVSEPFVPSHCGEMPVYDGRVIALDRRTGAYRWSRRVPQTTGDQNAYLRAHVAAGVVVFETWSRMRALDARGRLLWSRVDLPAGCRGGVMTGPLGEVRRRGDGLEWDGERGACRLSLKTGSIRRIARPARGSPLPVSTGRGSSARGWRLGSASDRRGTASVIASPSPAGSRVLIRHRGRPRAR